MLNNVIQRLETLINLSPAFRTFLLEHLTEITVAHDEFLLLPFQVCDRLAFLGEGQMHAYRKVGNHRITCRFYQPGDLCIDPTGYFTRAPSAVYIAPIAGDCVLYELNTSARAEISRFAEWSLLWEKFITDALVADEALLFMFRTMYSRERYEWAKRSFPGIEENVRKRQFASFLGVAPATVYEIERQDKRSADRKRQTRA